MTATGEATFAFAAGVLTFFSPCVFALLPGYVGYYVGAVEAESAPLSGAVARGLAASAGALGTFAVLSVAALGATTAFERVLPVVEPLVGVLLVGLGVALLWTGTLTPAVALPERRASVLGFVAFGALYALAATACVLPLFLSITVASVGLSVTGTALVLAAYAAALRVLTQYGSVEEWDIERELSRSRSNGEQSPIEGIIEEAVQVAADHLIPQNFDSFQWKTLAPEERLYLKGLELESHGEYRTGAYQELARGFGVGQYKSLYASSRANKTRFKTASEFGTKQLGEDGFEGSHVRHALFAVHEAREQDDAQAGRLWLRNELPDYWGNRKKLIEILRYLGSMESVAEHWTDDAKAARLVAGAVENDHA